MEYYIGFIQEQFQTNEFLTGAVGAGLIGGALMTLKRLALASIKFIRSRLIVEIHCTNDQDIYVNLQQWIAKQNTIDKRKNELYDHFELGNNVGRISFSDGWHLFWHKKRPVLIYKGKLDNKSMSYKMPETLSLFFFGVNAHTFVDSSLRALCDGDDNLIRVKLWSGDNWNVTETRFKRDINTIIMNNVLRNFLINDVESFLASKEQYIKRGLLYKRGYLFSGCPGTGKSSTVLALASMFNMQIYAINLSALESDTQLIMGFNEVPKHSIILLEDIDATVNNVKSRETFNSSSDKSISLAALLNVLDGMHSKEDVIVIMTSNYPETLDAALLRKGRVDQTIHFEHLDRELSNAMFNLYYPDYDHYFKLQFLDGLSYPISGAELQHKLLSYEQTNSQYS